MFAPTKIRKQFLVLAALTGLLQTCFFAPAALARDYMPNVLNVSLLRQKDNSGEAMLRLSTTVNMTGCAVIHPLRHDVEINNIYLDVVVKGYSVDFSAVPGNPNACKKGSQYSTADIPLDRKLLEDNKIQQIRLVLDRGLGSDYYVVNLGKDRLDLTPRTQHIFKPGKSLAGGQIVLSHWYYPENTLILSAPRPGAPQASITGDFARANGLTPLENLMPDFVTPAGYAGRYYYVDGTGTLAAKVPGIENVAVGDGIYARRPGLYE